MTTTHNSSLSSNMTLMKAAAVAFAGTVLCASSAIVSAGCCFIGRNIFNISTPIASAAKIGGISMLALLTLAITASLIQQRKPSFTKDYHVIFVLTGMTVVTLSAPLYIRNLSITSSIVFSILGIVPSMTLLKD